MLRRDSGLRAFHGNPAIKAQYLARVAAHRAADELVRGQYWVEGYDGVFRGCAVGCTIHGESHAAYESELGIPEEIAQAEDVLFELMDEDEAMAWPERFLAAIMVGADLSLVAPTLLLWLIDEDGYNVARRGSRPYPEALVDLYRRWIDGEDVPEEEWRFTHQAALDDEYDAQENGVQRSYDAAMAVLEVALIPLDFGTHMSRRRMGDAVTHASYAGEGRTEGASAIANELIRLLQNATDGKEKQ